MDYEKAYKEALERAKAWVENRCMPSDTNRQGVLEDIFPELAESEDERIRKGLIGYFMYLKSIDKNVLSDITNDNILAWLEKQKEFVSTDFDDVWEWADCDELTAPLEKYSKNAIKEMCHAWFDKGIELERKNRLKKQGEQKPADKVILKFKVGDWVTIKE